MKPYYEDDFVTIYHGEALELLPSLPRASFDCVVTDPPYVIGAVSAGNMASKAGGWADMMNSALWFTAWYQMVDRLLLRNGSFWTFCNWRSLPVVMRAALDARIPVTSLLVWDKETLGTHMQGLRPSHEFVALLAGPDYTVPNRSISDVWREPMGGKPNGHPAEKPELLLRRILMVAGATGLVLDPFLGSGTTAEAAKTLGLRCIGIEAEEAWCEVAARRCSQEVLAL